MITILKREFQPWFPREVTNLTNKLNTEITGLPSKPAYLVLQGEFSKESILRALGGCFAFTVSYSKETPKNALERL